MKTPKRILIMGLPGAGKTYLAGAIKEKLIEQGKTVGWLNADEVRRYYNDWDFSVEGRIRQSMRMRELAEEVHTDFVLVDFIAPLVEMRTNFMPDYVVWVDTIKTSSYPDTDAMFVPPTDYNIRVTEQDSERWGSVIVAELTK